MCADYGGLTDNGNRWISGYDLYYRGMSNRVEDVFTIKTHDSKGILTLKNWIHNHLGESLTGGVASFYSGSPWNATFLPSGTPEQGKYVMTKFSVPASHAMTIVGYNDSIRYDYNNDGQYTNHLDTNNDGIVDVRDWEIGGFKFVNSYGATSSGSTDSGFCYMMYRTLADDYAHGGIWNNAVHVVKVKPGYSPMLTMKVKLHHSSRNAIKISAGVSGDPTSFIPEHTIDFPIFNFQGGNFPMQGAGTSDTMNSIEFGLDITPLLSYMQMQKDAAIFLIVDENDPFSQANGRIEYFSVIDYSESSPKITEFQPTPLEISNNDITYAKVVVKTNANKVLINNTVLPPITAGLPYSVQLSANGGQPPYSWSLNYGYTRLSGNQPLAAFNGTKLIAQHPSDSILPVPLPFDFPFYGKKYDTIYVNMNNGYLQFTTDNIPWPYFSEENLLFRSYRMIVPFSNQNLNANKSDEGAWYITDSTSASFRWVLSKKNGEVYFPVECQATLAADGSISVIHSPISVAANELFHSGISDGDKQNYELSIYHSEYEANRFNYTKYIPASVADDLKISKTGLVECLPESGQLMYTIPCKVTDYLNVSDEKSFLISSGITAALRINAGNDSIIAAGETVSADLVLKNISNTTYSNLDARLGIDDSFISLIDTVETIGSIGAYQELTIPDAFRFIASTTANDEHVFLMDLKISNIVSEWKRSIPVQIIAPVLKTIELKTSKPGNTLLRPGETGWLYYKFANIGHASAMDVDVSISITDPRIVLLTASSKSVGEIAPGAKSVFDFQVTVADSTLLGTQIPILIKVLSQKQAVFSDTLYIRIGKAPVQVIDLDINHESAPVIYQQIRDLGYLADYTSVITAGINEYQSVFINLGKFSSRHILSYTEGAILTDFLDRGGNLYIESLNFWRDDLLTSLQPRFNIQTVNKFRLFDTLAGSPGSFTENMIFVNTGYQVSMYHLKPLGSAFTIFDDGGYYSAIANDAHTYKTIGGLFNFSTMQGINELSTQPKLMQSYLDFFSIKRDAIGIKENIKLPGTVSVYPNPAWDKASITFILDDNSSPVNAIVFDMNGRTVARLKVNSQTGNGSRSIDWNLCNHSGQKVPAGIYICRIVNKKEVLTCKIMVK